MREIISKRDVLELDRKLGEFKNLYSPSSKSWINEIRTTLRMSRKQLGAKIEEPIKINDNIVGYRKKSITPQGIKDLEKSEVSGSISLNTLIKIGRALDLDLVYGFVPKGKSFALTIDIRTMGLARQIVPGPTAGLEGDHTEEEEKYLFALKRKSREIEMEHPKNFWD